MFFGGYEFTAGVYIEQEIYATIDIVEVINYRLVVQIHINGLYYRIFAHVNLSIVFADRIALFVGGILYFLNICVIIINKSVYNNVIKYEHSSLKIKLAIRF